MCSYMGVYMVERKKQRVAGSAALATRLPIFAVKGESFTAYQWMEDKGKLPLGFSEIPQRWQDYGQLLAVRVSSKWKWMVQKVSTTFELQMLIGPRGASQVNATYGRLSWKREIWVLWYGDGCTTENWSANELIAIRKYFSFTNWWKCGAVNSKRKKNAIMWR